MTYEEIQKANELIQTTDIKGKNYVEVSQRIKAFRSVCPNGKIKTEILKLENGFCLVKAAVYDEQGMVLGTGHAYETEGSSFINKLSYIENCETSAVGRALGMSGFGIDTAVRSFEETANAELNRLAEQKIDAIKIKSLEGVFEKHAGFKDEVLAKFKIDTVEDMTEKQYKTLIKMINKKKE